MQGVQITIPLRLDFERLRRIVAAWPRDAQQLTLNFERQEWVDPIGTTGLSCLVAEAIMRGQQIRFETTGCQNLGYWGRMGFFENFGLDELGKQGQPRPPRGRFSVVRRVTPDTENDQIAHEIVQVQQPSEEAYQIYQHIVSEALDNISQHSAAEGFTASQYYESQRRSAFCIADYGCGLRRALYRFEPENDEHAILKRARSRDFGTEPESATRRAGAHEKPGCRPVDHPAIDRQKWGLVETLDRLSSIYRGR
jgi:hypothetical protein